MAINQNHLFEDLNGIKCSIVEKNASKARVDFLKRILEYNRYTVIVVPSPPPPPPKVVPAPPPAAAAPVSASAAVPAPPAPASMVQAPAPPAPIASVLPVEPDPAPALPAEPSPVPAPIATPAPIAPPAPPPPETFTIGVTDTTFNPTNAIFGRLLKAPGGHTVTLAYWQQKESTPDDEVPYFDAKY